MAEDRMEYTIDASKYDIAPVPHITRSFRTRIITPESKVAEAFFDIDKCDAIQFEGVYLKPKLVTIRGRTGEKQCIQISTR
jgi:hypothetical protein